jgi:diguanylate cyclase (GGDEF)-like protein/PAS domain S-box-containing protein
MIGLHRDGSEIPLAVSYSPVITAGGVVYTNIVHDLSTLRKTEEQLRLQAQALNAAANGMVLSTAEGIILWVNAAFTEMTGYLAGEALGKSTRLLRSGIHDHNFYREMWTTILAGQVWRGELTNRRKDGSLYVEYQTISPVLGPGGRITHFIAVKQDVTERKRAEEQLRQQARELAIINEIGQAAASNLDLSTLIQLVGQKIHQIFGAWMVYIALLNEQTGFTEFPFYMIEGKQVPDPGTLAPGEGLTAVVMRERVPLLIDKDFADRADQLGAVPTSTFAVQRPKTWIGIPIVGGERVIGVLSVQDADREQAYSQDELRLLTTVAANLGVAIENARLYQTEQERRAEAETLQEVTAALTASLQRDEVLAIILQQLKRVVSYDSASVMQWDDEESLRVVAHAGFRSQSQSDFRPTRETAPNIWRVVTEKRYCLVPDTWEDPSWNRDATEEDYIRCWMGTPLIFKGEAIGLLNIDNERPNAYSERDLRIASVFADQAAIAIENARLYEQAQSEIGHRRQTELSLREANRSLVQQVREIAALQVQLREQALRDPVTGLYNRRYLDESLPREIGRAEREHGQVGAIMMDLDHFKAINDAYGHINGDKALVSLGELLNTRSRTSDIACRFGGEEFCLILPGATLRAVLDRAEELRAAFEGTTISTDQGSFHVTISLGAAIFPLHANSAESLVARADEALYRAKRAGRNCVILAGSHGSSAQEAQLPS